MSTSESLLKSMGILTLNLNRDCGLELSQIVMILHLLFLCLGLHLNAIRRNPLPNLTLPVCPVLKRTLVLLSVVISPGKSVDLHMKKLRFIQQLFDDNILSQEDVSGTKESILKAIHKL